MSFIIPEGAIPHSTEITIDFVNQYGPFGLFNYPNGYQPVSATVWFYITPQIVFFKPVENKLAYVADCKNENNCEALTFLKAHHLQKDEQVFQFSTPREKSFFTSHTFNGSLYTHHFCVYCVAKHDKSDTNKAIYSTIVAEAKQ